MQVLLQFLMQNQITRSLIGSSFHRRRQNQLANYLINEMEMEPDLAHLLLRIHEPTNINQTLNLFLTDENDIVNHVFIPKEDRPDVCRVCETPPQRHQEHNPDRVNEEIKKEQESVRNSFSAMSEPEQIQPKFTCEICYIQVIKSDMLQINEEIHNICLQCMESYLKEEIGNMRIENIRCPHCGLHLPPDLIRQLIDDPTYNKYRLFIRNMEIQKNPHLKWCPNPKCSVVVSTNANKKTSKCPKCSTEICNKCNREAHPRSSCHGAFKKEIQDWENASDIQKCKKCQGLVEKIAGCNHMTCSICHYQWCWLCGSEYSSAHFNTLNPFGCPGLQDRPRDDWGKCKILMLRIGLLLLFILGIPVLLPVAMLICGPLLIGNLMWHAYYSRSCCKRFGIVLFAIIFGIPADPFIWIGSIFYFIPFGIKQLYNWCKRRRQNASRMNDFLQQRLIGEQVFQQKQEKLPEE